MSLVKFDTSGCGCCQPLAARTPETIENRPGLPAIQYRAGRYESFRETMILAIARQPALRLWRARDTRDFGIALLDLWAYLAEILTFYQERIANEAFLRTATQRESVLRLAALIDYKLGPGAAALAHLAFTLDRGKQLSLPTGLRVQSVPGQNEKPQKFETVESVSADAAYNRVRVYPAPAAFNPFASGGTGGTLLPDTTTTPQKALAVRDPLALFDSRRVELKEIASLAQEDERTELGWTPPVRGSAFLLHTARLAPYNRQFRVFGSTAPEQYLDPVVSSSAPGGIKWTLRSVPTDYSYALAAGAGVVPLESRVEDLKAGAQVLLWQVPGQTASEPGFARLCTVSAVEAQPVKLGPLKETVTQLSLDLHVASPPVAARDSSNRLHVFVIGDDQAVWHRRQESAGKSTYTSWESLGGQVTLLAVGRNSASQIELFARGVDGALWRLQQAAGDQWQAWQSLGGQINLLAVGRHADGRLAVFARGADLGVWFTEQDAHFQWSAWGKLGGVVDRLAVETNQDGRLEVFARGADGAVWHNPRVAVNGAWKGWSSLGGWVDLLAVARNADGRLEVFGRGLDKALWHNRQTTVNGPSWSGWSSLGGWIDLLGVAAGEGGRLEVFVRGVDWALWHKWQTAPSGTTWSNWFSRGGLIDMLGVGVNQNGEPETFVRGMDKGLWRNRKSAGAWSGWSSLGLPMWPVPDRRRLTVIELSRTPVRLSGQRYPATITGSQVWAPLASLSSLAAGRSAILDDSQSDAQTVTVTSATPSGSHLVVRFTPALARTLDSKTAVLYGNVAKATHGETVRNEVLGSGNASTRFQTFQLKKSPVTFVTKAGAPKGVASTLEVRVDGVLWREVTSLLKQSSEARVYTTSLDDEGAMTVQFGGEPGARVPTGRNNVVATYRQGLGTEGDVKAGTLTTLLDRPAGLKSVTNPAAARGGASQETLALARINAPNTVRTFGRVVSLRDFEDAARESAVVAKARAVVDWQQNEQAVILTLAGEGGAQLSDAVRGEVAADLDSRRDPNRKMIVRNHAAVPVAVSAKLQVQPDYRLEDVESAARAALKSFFAFDRLDLGQPVFLSEVFGVLQKLKGVVAVDIDRFQVKGAGGEPVQATLVVPPHGIATLAAADTGITTQFESL